jgi:hypothetical protein
MIKLDIIKRDRGEGEIVFLTSTLYRDEWSASFSSPLTPGVRVPGTHQIGGRVGPRASQDTVVKRKIPNPATN